MAKDNVRWMLVRQNKYDEYDRLHEGRSEKECLDYARSYYHSWYDKEEVFLVRVTTTYDKRHVFKAQVIITEEEL